jgi:RNA polymerase sigma-70 factor (ECF subfamily)
MDLIKRQDSDNLVYWPVAQPIKIKSTKTKLKRITQTMSAEESNSSQVLHDDPVRWRHHMKAVAEKQDRGAFHALYLHFSPKIKSFYLQKGMMSNAEELTHEVFMKIWQKASSYNSDKAKVSTWIFTIVRNSRIDFLRKKRLDEVPEDDHIEAHEESDYDEKIDFDRRKQQIANIFELLSEEQRNVLQKVYFEDKSHQIAAQELEMTAGVVKSRIRSALKILRSHMGDGAI